jgi:hypothetical protein
MRALAFLMEWLPLAATFAAGVGAGWWLRSRRK